MALGWRAEGPNSKGYFKLKCPCPGKHLTMVHKTPSNPNYWKERKQFIERSCKPIGEEGA